MVTGQVEAAQVRILDIDAFLVLLVHAPTLYVTPQFHGFDNLYCKTMFHHGDDWTVVNVRAPAPSASPRHQVPTHTAACAQGIEIGISQIAKKASNGENVAVWNFPIDATFKSTNVFGWPRLVLNVRPRCAFARLYEVLASPRPRALLSPALSGLAGLQPGLPRPRPSPRLRQRPRPHRPGALRALRPHVYAASIVPVQAVCILAARQPSGGPRVQDLSPRLALTRARPPARARVPPRPSSSSMQRPRPSTRAEK